VEVAPEPDEPRRAIRRRRLATPTAIGVAVAALAVAVVWIRQEPQTKVPIGVGPSVSVRTACAAVVDRSEAGIPVAFPPVRAARAEVSAALGAADDPTLVGVGSELGALDGRPDGAAQAETVYQRAVSRCRALGAEGFRPRFVAGSLGPEPAVALDAYGTVVAWRPVGARVPDALLDGRDAPVGNDLSPVEVLVTTSGAW
jgi:hypothetical protein